MSAYSDRIIADGASNYWRLGETSGTSAVDIVGAKNGTISGGVTLAQAGAIADGDTAMLFDATGDYVSVPPSIAIGTGPFTLECWLKSALAQPATAPFIIENGGGANGAGFALVRSSTTTVDFKIANGTTNISTTGACPFDGHWHHVVGTLTRGTPDVIRIYVDGVLINAGSPPANGWNLTSPLALLFGTYSGGQASPDFRYFGSIDDIAIYPRALTAPEIAAHYSLGKTPPAGVHDLNTKLWIYLSGFFGVTPGTSYVERVRADGATHHWRLGEGSGTVAVDAIGGANGTISGGVTLGQPSALVDGDTAMLFNGTTGKIVTPDFGTLVPPFSVELWLRGTNPDVPFFGSTFPQPAGTDMLAFQIGAGQLYVFTAYANAASPNSSIPCGAIGGLSDGVWHHVVLVFTTTTAFTTYVDSVVRTPSVPLSRPLVGVDARFDFGYSNAHGIYWPGSLDDIALYPRALTANEVAAHYSLGRQGLSGANDLTTLITRYLATLSGDYTARWKQMEQDAAGA